MPDDTSHIDERTAGPYREFRKVDAHLHLNADRAALPEAASEEGFSLITINTEVPFFPDPVTQQDFALKHSGTAGRSNSAKEQSSTDPGRSGSAGFSGKLNFITTFSTDSHGAEGWQEKAIGQIRDGLDKGAVAVKVWKNIGMSLQDRNGRFVMIDDPSFDPVLEFIVKQDIPLLAHLGEPKNCWLPLEQMTVTSDREYFASHPRYHMHLRPEYPSYEEQLAARDRMLSRHPDLHFVGAHLASLEWSVKRLARWLEDHPNAGVDLAERVCHLQHQAAEDRGLVRQFAIKYQDRIIYGSDQIDDGRRPPEEICREIRQKWRNEFAFFSGSGVMSAWNVDKPFRGLDLPEPVLRKIFRDNASRYYPRLSEA